MAKKLSFEGPEPEVEDEEEIEVFDDQVKWFGYGSAYEGNRGFALPRGEGKYSIVSMGTWARYIRGTITGDGCVTHTDNVTFWDGQFVRADGGEKEGPITLSCICIDPNETDEFVAVFNEKTRMYQPTTFCCTEEGS
jgi:hypothetical protein